MYYDNSQAVFVRTVTFHYVGRIVNVSHDHVTGRQQWLTLERASWIADTGARMSEFLRRGPVEAGGGRTEYEMYPSGVVINADAIVDIAPIAGELPTLGATAPVIQSEEDVFRDGQRVYIRSVTFHSIGIIERCIFNSNDALEAVRLRDAFWVPDTGVRMQDFLTDGPADPSSDAADGRPELEAYPSGVTILAGGIVDATLMPRLPTRIR